MSEPDEDQKPEVVQQRLVRRLFESRSVYVYSVKLLRENPEDPRKQDRSEEWYAAERIDDVWAAMELELQDERVEVEAITRHVPLLAFLSPNREGKLGDFF